MTVISGMRFNPRQGAIVADEQSSNSNRKYDIAQKLHTLSAGEQPIQAVIGGSGAADILHAVELRVDQDLTKYGPKLESAEKLAGLVGYSFQNVRNEFMDAYMRTNLGISWDEFKTGFAKSDDGENLQIEKGLMDDYRNLISGRDSRVEFIQRNQFLILCGDAKDVKLYTTHGCQTKPMPIARPYEVIGSGSDAADHALAGFFENRAREQKKDIDPIEGIIALLQATERASAVNVGVGGTPYIAIISDGKIIQPSENNSKLASEIVKAEKRDMLKSGFTSEALASLLYRNANFADVDQEMQRQAHDPVALNRILRGYKV
ncbi:MAG: hypothetical protein KKF46_01875 [Nanoarchaeota archaeon]|nr:hypothetical protein [Nanoarchaeota archaeon]MBU1321081.1 hypothetical protein [Nanoarchaeota archaeon]MBU1598281.1 hypothetical protein [Nanoarchaeota archaeon]MBU2441330.1 hypothetical protein [Nanoarchaeota archaeon]